jgi:hypothetical protein
MQGRELRFLAMEAHGDYSKNFLHWVDPEGPWRGEAFDRKPAAQAVDFVLN